MARNKSDATPTNQIFGVYQKPVGSYTVDGNRFTPLAAVACDETVKDAACSETSPVKFFESEDAAGKEIERLKAVFAAQPKNQ